MKCTFSAREPNILMEAQPGDLFVPLGPDLVECVCAVRTCGGVPDSSRLDPSIRLVVVVIACRIEKGEPEYYPTGFTTSLVGATPISFLEQVEPAAFRERGPHDDSKYWNVEVVGRTPPVASYPDDFSVVPIQRSPLCTGAPRVSPVVSTRPDDARPGVCVGGFSYPDDAKPIAATESTGAPISRL